MKEDNENITRRQTFRQRQWLNLISAFKHMPALQLRGSSFPWFSQPSGCVDDYTLHCVTGINALCVNALLGQNVRNHKADAEWLTWAQGTREGGRVAEDPFLGPIFFPVQKKKKKKSFRCNYLCRCNTADWMKEWRLGMIHGQLKPSFTCQVRLWPGNGPQALVG